MSEPATIYQLGDRAFPHLKTIANSNLPTPASSFLGRERELYEADELLTKTRLLTVSGPGGQGKTRFALELAIRAREERFRDYEDGVYSAFLSSLRDPSLVLVTIAVSLGVHEQPGQSAFEALSGHLQGKQLLVLLDNLEHLPASFRELAELLSACPGLTLLCTSRERLRLQAERVYELPPLSETESVSLFCERAQTEPDDPTRELCAKLEGLPLAIELAAARTSVLTPEQISIRLSQRIDFLKGGPDRDPRQETLRATIEWSYDLLSPQEQTLFACLSVFAGGCTLEAAEDVAEADLDMLQSFVEKSLLRFTEERYWMLETIREFAAEKLETSGQADELRQRHAESMVALGREAQPELTGPEQESWFDRLQEEQGNLRIALNRLQETEQTDLLLELLASLLNFWNVRGGWIEPQGWYEHALSASEGQRSAARAWVLLGAERGRFARGDFGAVETLAAESLSIFRELGDDVGIGAALVDYGIVLAHTGRYEEGRGLLEEAAVRLDDAEDTYGAALARGNLVNLALTEGDHERAVSLGQQTVARCRELAVPELLGWSLDNLALSQLLAGHPELAVSPARESVALSQRLGFREQILQQSLYILAGLAARRDSEAAVRLLGGADTLREEARLALEGIEADFADELRSQLRLDLGEERYGALVAEGATMTLEEAVAFALGVAADA